MKKLVLIAMLAVLFVPANLADKNEVRVAGTRTVTPALLEDSYITALYPTSNYGNDSVMTIGLHPSGKSYRAFLKFERLSIPANATIESAYLKLGTTWCYSNPSVTNIYIAAVTGNWSESTITWNNQPSGAGYVTGNSACNSQFMNYSIKSLVEDWKRGTVSQDGLILYGPMAGTTWYRSYPTSESPEPKPVLQITYSVPDSVPPSTGSSTSSSSTSSSSGGSNPSSSGTTTGNSSSTGSNTSTSDTPTSNTDTPKSSSGGLPTKGELETLVKELSAGGEGMNFWDKLFASWFYLGPIIGFLFWALVIGLIVFLVHRHKKFSSSDLSRAEPREVENNTTSNVEKKKAEEPNLPRAVNPEQSRGESRGAAVTSKKKVDTLTKSKGK